MSQDMYNIKNYTDNQLFDILNLNQHPSDKELEDRINSFINQYKNIPTETGVKIYTFFNNIYDHFFESEYTQDTDNKETDDKLVKRFLNSLPVPTTAKPETITTNDPNPIILKSNEQPTRRVESIISVGYSKGNINPLLKQTRTVTIVLDSAYRDTTTYPFSTDYVCYLSHPLNYVLSLKLYSVSIPYAWHTINADDYGGNFFYLKGNSPGINNGYHDYKIEVRAGDYTAPELIDEINNNISKLRNTYTDVSFGNTGISYRKNDCLSTITIDITKMYNESDYYIDFNHSLNGQFNGQYTDIASFLGYNTQTINTNTSITSSYPFTSGSSVQPIYLLNNTNNYFTIYQYSTTLQSRSTTEYTNPSKITFIPKYNGLDPNCIIDFSFNVFITLPLNQTYTRFELYKNLITSLKSNKYLNSLSTITITDASNNIYILDDSNHLLLYPSTVIVTSPPSLFFQLTIILNKKTTVNAVNEKIYITFLNEISSQYNIWTTNPISVNPDSGFLFNTLPYELNNITSFNPMSSTLYKQPSVAIILQCIKNGYDNSYNTYNMKVSTQQTGYNLFEYLYQINESIIKIDGVTSANDPIIKVRPLATSDYNTNISNTAYMSFKFNFTKTFTKEYYTIDLNNTILYDLVGSSINKSINIYPNEVAGGDISFNILYNGSQYNIIDINKSLIKIIPVGNGNKTSNSMDISLNLLSAIVNTNDGSAYYTTIELLVTDITNSINTYIDHVDINVDNLCPFKGSRVKINEYMDNDRNYINVAINLLIIKTLSQNDYNVTFQNLATIKDTSYNSTLNSKNDSTDISGIIFYGSYIKDDNGNTNITYHLSDYSRNIIIPNYITYSEISGNLLTSNLLNLGDTNSIVFYLRPIKNDEGGVYVSNGTDNVIPITLTTSSNTLLTQYSVFHQINTQLNDNQLSKGSYIYTNSSGNTVFRLNINKIYTANDYIISFYDEYSFVKCYIGHNSVSNVASDQTLGWILGFRELLIYDLATIPSLNNQKILTSDTGVSVNLYDYFLIELDDYTQNRINDNLVSISTSDNSIALPTYANKYTLMCDKNGKTVYPGGPTNVGNIGTITSAATQSQIYSANQILTSRKNKSKPITSGPYTKDLFAMIPIPAGKPGETYTASTGSLNLQSRTYFGPVNLYRFSVKLLNNRGEKVNLNKSNWTFSLLCDQLYNPKDT